MDKVVFLWNGYEPILRIVVVGTVTYATIICLLRISGKRTLATMNAFDFIVTIAIGSAFGRILTAKQVSIAESVTTFLLLITLQYLVSVFRVKSTFFSSLITSDPSLLYYKGKFLEKEMKKERLRQRDLLKAVRKKKFSSLDSVEAIILETDGSFSVVKKSGEKENYSYQEFLTPENR